MLTQPNHNDDNYINFPEMFGRRELNALYREIPLEDTVSRKLRKFFEAMANFYGIIPLNKAYKILCKLNPGLVSENDFYKFAKIAVHEDGVYLIMQESDFFDDTESVAFEKFDIIHMGLILDNPAEHYGKMKYEQGTKPYCVPKNITALLKYAKEDYVEPTEAYTILKNFVMRTFHLNDMDAKDLLSILSYDIRFCFSDFEEVISILELFKINTEKIKKKDLEQFITLYMDFHNSTSMPLNRGFSPNELMAKARPKDFSGTKLTLGEGIKRMFENGEIDIGEAINKIDKINFPNEEMKIGFLRELSDLQETITENNKQLSLNASCPCGSGKKYKRCCGKKQ